MRLPPDTYPQASNDDAHLLGIWWSIWKKNGQFFLSLISRLYHAFSNRCKSRKNQHSINSDNQRGSVSQTLWDWPKSNPKSLPDSACRQVGRPNGKKTIWGMDSAKLLPRILPWTISMTVLFSGRRAIQEFRGFCSCSNLWWLSFMQL